jgi:ribonuclease P protein component
VVRRTRQGFPAEYRIVRGSDYRSVYDSGLKIHSGRFVLFARPNALGHNRLGITVSRRIGGAVIRNRVKRLFREVFRRSPADNPPSFDLVINAKRGCAVARYDELYAECCAAFEKACRQGNVAGSAANSGDGDP